MNRDFLIWLVQQLKFPIPTIEQIENSEQIVAYNASWKDKTGRLCKLRAYKLAIIYALLIGDNDMYDFLCFQLLGEQLGRKDSPWDIIKIMF